VTARDILRTVLGHGATGFLLVHNHPSGEPRPSAEDYAMTKAVARAAEVVGIPLVDHVIVTANGDWASLLEAGAL
jgi:DNA repair protein RadC